MLHTKPYKCLAKLIHYLVYNSIFVLTTNVYTIMVRTILVLLISMVVLTSQTPTPYINSLVNIGASIKVIYNNGTYQYVHKQNISRVVNFTSSPQSVTIETNRRGSNNQDNTIRVSANQLTSPVVASGKALTDTISLWLYETTDINTTYLINATSCP
jgi:hypothetical protein